MNSFRQLDLPDLLINVWCYTECPNSPVPKQCSKWCVSAAKRKWSPNFIDFDFVIDNIKKRNKNWFDFGSLSNATKNNIYKAIRKLMPDNGWGN